MEIQEINLGRTLVRPCLQGSGRLVVSFEPGGHAADIGQPAWAQALVAKAGWDGLHIIPKVLDWYQSPEIWRYLALAERTGFFDGYDEVVTYGSSMGGFAAMATARLVRAKRVVALQPRSSLRWSVPWPSAQSSQLSYPRRGARAEALDGLTADMDICLFADPFYQRDWHHASRVPAAMLFRVPLVQHRVPQFFQEMGLLGALARRAISGTLERGWYREKMRGRRRSSIYRRGLAAALCHRSQPEGAVVEQGVRQLGPDPEAE